MARAVGFLTAALLASAGYAAEPAATAQAEIHHLLVYLERSGCEFFRNGRWHPAADARQHLERKYRYLVEKRLVSSAEDFIARAASESSMSGRPYQVRCGTAAPVPSARWLTDELRRYRSGQPPSRQGRSRSGSAVTPGLTSGSDGALDRPRAAREPDAAATRRGG